MALPRQPHDRLSGCTCPCLAIVMMSRTWPRFRIWASPVELGSISGWCTTPTAWKGRAVVSPRPGRRIPGRARPAAAEPPRARAGGKAGKRSISGRSYIVTVRAQMGPLIHGFQKANPNRKVNVQYLPQATLGQASVTALQAGNAPAVLYT